MIAVMVMTSEGANGGGDGDQRSESGGRAQGGTGGTDAGGIAQGDCGHGLGYHGDGWAGGKGRSAIGGAGT